jgi:hypothetical protein
MKKSTDQKPSPRPTPNGDRQPDNPPLGDPPTEPPPVDESDVPTPAVEAMRIDET